MAPNGNSTRRLTVVALIAAVSVVAITAIGVALKPGKPQAEQRPVPSVTAPATPVPTPTPSLIPTSCDKVYTRDWKAELAPFVLNPDWAKAQPSIGSNDVQLVAELKPNIRLTCQWGKPNGGGDSGIVTSLAEIDEQTDSAVRTRFNTLGWTCFDVAQGVRCITEGSDANGSWGESHFLRDGIWIATRWVNLAPDGYTGDIIATLWP